jgi:polyisoprenoid-binding protein YceI
MFSFVLAVMVGCVEDVGEGKVAATVEEVPAAPAPPPEPPPAPARSFVVTKEKSSINALGAKISATHPINFPDFSGTIEVAGDQVKSLAFEVQVATLTTDHPKLQAHLLDADFLDAPTHPTASFKSAEITAAPGENGATHTVAGDLTLRGTAKRVTFPATITASGDTVTAKTEFVINRQDFGITYPGKADDLVQDNVVLTVAFEAAPAAAAAPAAEGANMNAAPEGAPAGGEGKAGKAGKAH